MSKNVNVICFIGVTKVGKSYLAKMMQDKMPEIGIIDVGAEIRKRHPPEYFEGQGAMEKTEPEVYEIITSRMKELCVVGNVTHIILTGNPRLVSQYHFLKQLSLEGLDIFIKYVWLYENDDIIQSRINQIEDAGSRELSQQRLKNDKVMLYPVIHELIANEDLIATTPKEFFKIFEEEVESFKLIKQQFEKSKSS